MPRCQVTSSRSSKLPLVLPKSVRMGNFMPIRAAVSCPRDKRADGDFCPRCRWSSHGCVDADR
eukprot:358273-Chlamydomonas_euryale.AAC.3